MSDVGTIISILLAVWGVYLTISAKNRIKLYFSIKDCKLLSSEDENETLKKKKALFKASIKNGGNLDITQSMIFSPISIVFPNNFKIIEAKLESPIGKLNTNENTVIITIDLLKIKEIITFNFLIETDLQQKDSKFIEKKIFNSIQPECRIENLKEIYKEKYVRKTTKRMVGIFLSMISIFSLIFMSIMYIPMSSSVRHSPPKNVKHSPSKSVEYSSPKDYYEYHNKSYNYQNIDSLISIREKEIHKYKSLYSTLNGHSARDSAYIIHSTIESLYKSIDSLLEIKHTKMSQVSSKQASSNDRLYDYQLCDKSNESLFYQKNKEKSVYYKSNGSLLFIVCIVIFIIILLFIFIIKRKKRKEVKIIKGEKSKELVNKIDIE